MVYTVCKALKVHETWISNEHCQTLIFYQIPGEISHFFFGPSPNHFSWIVATIAMPKSWMEKICMQSFENEKQQSLGA